MFKRWIPARFIAVAIALALAGGAMLAVGSNHGPRNAGVLERAAEILGIDVTVEDDEDSMILESALGSEQDMPPTTELGTTKSTKELMEVPIEPTEIPALQEIASPTTPSTPIIVPNTVSPTSTTQSVDPTAASDQYAAPTKIVYVSEEWADVWLCKESPVESADLTAGGTQTCSVSTKVVGDNLVITSTGIPNHDFESTLGCCASEQNSVWTIPLEPEISGNTPVMAPDRGPVAFTVTGVAIYGPEEGPGGDAVALEYGYFVEDRQPVDLGVCGGHAGPVGEYHYHYDSNCMHWHEDGKSIGEYDVSELASSVISKVIAFAFDGFPIYSTYEEDLSGVPVEITSSYRLKSGENGYGGIDDYDYVENLGDLDECNGHFGATPEAPDGIYHYHSTLTNGEGNLGFPYFPLCYIGNVNEENYQPTVVGGGGLRGGPPPNTNPPATGLGGPPPPRR